MHPDRQKLIQSLFDEFLEMYVSRDERLLSHFSENFSGYTGGGDFLVKDREHWVKVTKTDFAEVPDRLNYELLDISMQDLSDDVFMVVGFFHIHLPFPDHILSRETARGVLVFRREGDEWKIAHSGMSIPYHLVGSGDDEVYPVRSLGARNRELEALVEERTLELEDARKRLEALSNTDALTGIANRRAFDAVFAQEWNRGQRAGTPLGLVMLDVDHFKDFNDVYGHLAGDRCLQKLAEALAQSGRRAGELAARYGGEEFVVLLPNTNLDDAFEAARRIQQEVWSLALPHEGMPAGMVTASLGVASLVPTGGTVPEDLLYAADQALYRAKQSGRNCIRMADD